MSAGIRTDERNVIIARILARLPAAALEEFLAATRERHEPRLNPFKPLPALEAPLPPEQQPTNTKP